MLSKLRLLAMIRDLKEKGARICGISAPSRASTLVNYVGLDEAIIDYVCEIPGSLKIGKYMPGTLIPVVEESRLFTDQPDCAIIFSWHIADELAPKLRAKGYRGTADHAAAGAAGVVTAPSKGGKSMKDSRRSSSPRRWHGPPLFPRAPRSTQRHPCISSAVSRRAPPPTSPPAWSAPRSARSSASSSWSRTGPARRRAWRRPLVARAPKDGYTLLIGSAANVINAAMNPNLTFDFVKDFTPITLLTSTPTVLVVNPELGVKSVKDLVALAKAKPDSISFGSSGVASSTHLALELFKSLGQVKITHVPYTGSPQVVTDLLAGRIHGYFSPAPRP